MLRESWVGDAGWLPGLDAPPPPPQCPASRHFEALPWLLWAEQLVGAVPGFTLLDSPGRQNSPGGAARFLRGKLRHLVVAGCWVPTRLWPLTSPRGRW